MSGRSRLHLGDGVYAEYDGYRITLTTQACDNTIVLEPDVVASLHEYAVASYLKTRRQMSKLEPADAD